MWYARGASEDPSQLNYVPHFVFERQYFVLNPGRDPENLLRACKTYLHSAVVDFTYERCLKLPHYKYILYIYIYDDVIESVLKVFTRV